MIKIKFRLIDGSDIGPDDYEDQLTVESLKEKVIAGWPKGKKTVPNASQIKLISSGKILENSNTVGQCKMPFSDVDGVITMHVVEQQALTKAKSEKKIDDDPKKKICSCSIL